MTDVQPIATELDQRFSAPDAAATDWAAARQALEQAGIYWISTVRHDGRPHVTPLIAVVDGGAVYFCTGPTEQKAKNLFTNAHCVLTTGCNRYDGGLDVVVEGVAERVVDNDRLRRLVDAYVAKYGPDWQFRVEESAFHHEDGGEAWVYEVALNKVLGFRRDEPVGQTRWRFAT